MIKFSALKSELKKDKSTYIFLSILFLAALIVRIIYIYQIQTVPLINFVLKLPESFDQGFFSKVALKIAQGDWLLKEKNLLPGTAPVYAYFLGIIYKLFGFVPLAARIIQAFLGAAFCIILYFIGKETFNKSVGIISSFIASFYGIFIFYSEVLLRATLVTFLNVLLLLLLIKLTKKPNVKLSFFSAVVYELSFLTRQNILLPFILIWLFLSLRKTPFKKLLRLGTAFIAGIFITFSPFLIRNFIVFDKTIITPATSDGFWIGNTYDSPGVDLVWLPTYKEMTEKSQGSFIKTGLLFLEEVRKRPKAYINLYYRKIAMFLNGYEVPATLNYYLFRQFPTVLRFPWFSFTLVCPLALIGIILALFSKKNVSLLYVFWFALSAMVILFHIQARYRMPVIPLFIIFASYALYWCFNQIKEKKYNRLAILGVVIIPLFMFIKPDPSYRGYFQENRSFIRYADYTNLANSYIYKLGELKEDAASDERFINDAIKYLKKKIELFPPARTAYYRFHLGLFYSQKGLAEQAKKEWEHVLLLQPGYEPAKINLTLLKHKTGKVSKETIEAFEKLIEENPNDPLLIQQLGYMYLSSGRVDDAIALYKEAIYDNPEVVELYTLLKKANELKGTSQEEIKEKLKREPLDSLQTRQPDDISASLQLAMKYVSERKYDEAIATFKKILGKSPNSIQALINLGVTYRAAGEPEKAISCYERILEIEPEIVPARYNLAMVFLSQDKFEKAASHLDKIVSDLPEFFLAQFHLANSYEKLGRIEKAIEEYEKFISWAGENPEKQRQIELAEDKIAVLKWKLKNPSETTTENFLLKEGYE